MLFFVEYWIGEKSKRGLRIGVHDDCSYLFYVKKVIDEKNHYANKPNFNVEISSSIFLSGNASDAGGLILNERHP